MKKRILSSILSLMLIITLLHFTTVISNALTSTRGELVIGQIYTGNLSLGDEDWYQFSVEKEGYVVFALNCAFGGDISIYTRDGSHSIYTERTFRNALTNLDQAELTVSLLRGTFNIRVRDTSSATGNYTLTSTYQQSRFGDDTEPNDSASTAIPFPLNNPIGGHLGGANENGDTDWEDWYKLSVPYDGVVAINVISEIQCELSLYSDDGSRRIANVWEHNSNALTNMYELTIEQELQKGVYYVQVECSSSGDGGYQLTATNSQAANLTLTVAPITDETNPNITVGNKLSWESIDGVDSYDIYRASQGDPFVKIASGITGNTYIDLNIKPGTQYSYKICPSGGNVDTTASNEATVTTGPEAAPLLPDADGELGQANAYILMQINNPMMDVNGQTVEVDPGRGTAPMIYKDRTVLPIRAVVEAMGGEVGWDSGEKKSTLEANGNTVVMWTGNIEYTVNGVTNEMDIAPFIENERTFLPLRFATANLNCRVTWINDSKEILIVYNSGE